jgi:dienelactone hydrolase
MVEALGFARRYLLRGLFLSLAYLGLAPSVSAQVIRIELHSLHTVTLSDQQFLTGATDGRQDIIAGELRLPGATTNRLPTVVLLHGSGGVKLGVERWSQELNSIGVATFVLDSFTGRGIRDTVSDQSQLGRFAMAKDAYLALKLLASHPRIDPNRIVLMGFSRGGQATLYASLQRFHRLQAPQGLEFAGYIVFYAACNTRYIEDNVLVKRPVRLFHGSADNYNPVAACREYVSRIVKDGNDVTLTEYPSAHHVFDDPSLKPEVALPKAQTTRNCILEESAPGNIVNAKSKEPFSYKDPCVELGATIGYNEAAHAAASRDVERFLTELLALK